MKKGSVQTKLSRFLLSYRLPPSPTHSMTSVPLAKLLTKQKLPTQLDQMVPDLGNRVRGKQSQQKAAHDYHAKERDLHEGQVVYVKDFRYKKIWMPGTIVKKTGPVSACVQLEGCAVVQTHQDQVRARETVEQAVTPMEAETAEAVQVVPDSTAADQSV